NHDAGRLRFTDDYADALAKAEFAFIAVDTPSDLDGGADLDHLRAAAASIARAMRQPLIIINKSTVPVGAGVLVADIVERNLATKISFINEIAEICERLGADVKEVARGMGLDKRIGTSNLDAGLGWGGSCFRKDVQALEYMAATNGAHPQLLRAVMDINRDARRRLVQRIREAVGGSLADRRI